MRGNSFGSFCPWLFRARAYVFDNGYCMKDVEAYKSEITRLKEKYADKIEILLGIEEDSHDPISCASDFDYRIGSSHYIKKNGLYYPVDSSPERFTECVDAFGGDILELAEVYYSQLASYVKERRPDIVGHFDLITKFEERLGLGFFENPDYLRISEKYLEQIIDTGALIEVNTGAISRGYRTSPYPHVNLLELIRRRGGRVVLNSDSHHKSTLTFAFSETRELLRQVGFTTLAMLSGGKIIEYSI